jgi:hypothetical protein
LLNYRVRSAVVKGPYIRFCGHFGDHLFVRLFLHGNTRMTCRSIVPADAAWDDFSYGWRRQKH